MLEEQCFSDVYKRQDSNNYDDITIDAGNKIDVGCYVKLPNELLNIDNIEAQVYYGEITQDGVVDDIKVIPMKLVENDDTNLEYKFTAKIELK